MVTTMMTNEFIVTDKCGGHTFTHIQPSNKLSWRTAMYNNTRISSWSNLYALPVNTARIYYHYHIWAVKPWFLVKIKLF